MLSQDLINQSSLVRMMPIKNKKDKKSLLVHEIYASLQGESSYMGIPCVFIRTTGCHLRCSYCDTAHAFFDGKEMSIDDVINEVLSYDISLVELTGGEPLLQKSSFELLHKLADKKLTVLLETSGGVSIKDVDPRVKVILDVKTPDSGQVHKNIWHNLDILWPGCEVKFVISSDKDYEFAKEICHKYDLYHKTHVLFSAAYNTIKHQKLADYILKDKLPVALQVQLHKILWGEEKGK